MKKVNIVPYKENQAAFGTNVKRVEFADSGTTVCECYINVLRVLYQCSASAISMW